jgi:ABC-type sugar transport system substrate-binding protein
VSLLALDNPFFKVIGDAITAEGSKQGFETIIVSADKDVARQGNQIKDFIVSKAAAIVLSPCDSKSIIPVIREANAAGIPVFTVDIPCNEPGVVIATQVATDNEGGGREAGLAMIEALGEAGGKIAVLHFKQAESCQLRVKGFRAAIEAHNATAPAKIDIVTELESNAAKDTGYKAMEDALQAFPDLRGVFAINDPAALGARAALEKAGKADQVKIIGFDGHQVAQGHAGFAGQIGQFEASGSAGFGQQGANRHAPVGTLRVSSISLFVFDHSGDPPALRRTWPLSSSGVNRLRTVSPTIAAVQHAQKCLGLPFSRACPMGASVMAGATLAN